MSDDVINDDDDQETLSIEYDKVTEYLDWNQYFEFHHVLMIQKILKILKNYWMTIMINLKINYNFHQLYY